MKRTIIVTPDSMQHKAIDALMAEIGYQEIERFVTGGLHSAIQYIITYQGLDADYNEDSFVFIPQNDTYGHYFSLSFTGGYFTNDIAIFIDEIKKSKHKIELQKFHPLTFK